MAMHTPGPWGIEQTEDTNWIGFMRPDGIKVELIVCTTDRYLLTPAALEKNDANARLIAAAPELLGALIQVLSEYKGVINPDGNRPEFDEYQEVIAARAAIAKATGATP